MFDLLLTITLDPLHQGLHGQVLILAEERGLTLHRFHHLLLVKLHFVHFLLVCLHAHKLGVIVLFDCEENFLLIPQSNEVFLGFVLHFSPDFLD